MADVTTVKKINNLLFYVLSNKYSSFYRTKYKKNKIELNNIVDFYRLPFLTRAEIVNTNVNKRMFLPEDTKVGVYYSSGTTNTPLCVYQTKYNFPKAILEKIKKIGLKRLLVLRPIWVGQASLETWSEFAGNQLLGDIKNLAMSAKAALEFGADSINTTGTIAVYFAPYLKKFYNLSKIKWLWLGGEYISSEKLKLIKKLYPNAYCEITFVSVETLNRGYRCAYLYKGHSNLYHPVDDYYFEVLSGAKSQETGTGELVVTNLKTDVPFPLIRYRTGDLVEIYKDKCKCGQKITMKVLGRSGFDSIKVHGVQIILDEVEKAAIISGIWPMYEYQLCVSEFVKSNKTKVDLTLKVDADKELSGEVIRRFAQSLKLSSSVTLSEMTDRGIFNLKVEYVGEISEAFKTKRLILS